MSASSDQRLLEDGTRIYIRPITPEDRDALAAGFERLSEESRYRRFFATVTQLSERELDYLTQVDHHDHEALVAVEASSDEGIGVARFVRVGDEAAEPAVVVADEWQRRGVASHLLEALAERARQEGIRQFIAPVLAENTAAIAAFERLGEVSAAPRGRETELTVDLTEPVRAQSRLHDLLRAIASGAVAPARGLWELMARRLPPPDGVGRAIVVGIEASAGAGYAAECAAELGWTLGVAVHLVAVYRPVLDDRSALERVLSEADGRLRARGVDVSSQLVAGDPALSFLHAAMREGAGLIVLESPPLDRGGSRGSAVWSAVAHNAHCNVLIARPPGSRRAH
jgi:RimJ/RimL family protein N-acetyltransferase/nucleotide-binding universal stress UspA family protein